MKRTHLRFWPQVRSLFIARRFLQSIPLLAARGGKEKESVSTDGSTSMQKVMLALGEAFMEDTGANFTYNATGSGTGIKAVRDGACDIVLCMKLVLRQQPVAKDLLMIAKYFERIGDHCTNIAEWVEFSVAGVHKSCQ